MLIALRFWKYHWSHKRSVIRVSGDNMAALAMVTKMQPHSATLGIIARELALDIADAMYEPQCAAHVPGVANVAADALSRRFEPNFAYSLPAVLEHSTEVSPPARDSTWWRSLVPRTSHTQQRKGNSSARTRKRPAR